MTHQLTGSGIRVAVLALGLMAWAAGGCGNGSDLSLGPTPTATRPASTATRTPTATARPTQTATPRANRVAGLVVVGDGVGQPGSDGLKPLPPESLPPVGDGFDRGLGNAGWVVDDGVVRGETDADGRFTVTGLAPGRHALRFTRTVDGNLMAFVVPIVVGDDGGAEVVAEVSWGLVRATSTYAQAGAAMRAVFAPNGAWLIARGDRLVELSDGWRTADGRRRRRALRPAGLRHPALRLQR
ncbi:MAG: hypothetical protein U0802_04130 [Candidatus Binatia bacterium]